MTELSYRGVMGPANSLSRLIAGQVLSNCPEGHVVSIKPATRREEQSARFHAICGALAKSKVEWNAKRRSKDQWKALLVSAWFVATKQEGEFGVGLENEPVFLRPSTTELSVSQMSELISYAEAYAVGKGVEIKD